MLSNAYFLAKFRFDTAENEPAKNLQNFAKCGQCSRTRAQPSAELSELADKRNGAPHALHHRNPVRRQTLRSRQISKLPKIFLCRPEMTAPVKKHLLYDKKIESFN